MLKGPLKYELLVSELDAKKLEYFNAQIRNAESELACIIPYFQPLIKNLIQFYVPIENASNDHVHDYGMSLLWFKGAVFFEKGQSFAIERRVENLAHELAHQVIINYQLNDYIIDGDLNEEVYSGIRERLRPAIMSFHGAAALSYMLQVASLYQNKKRTSELKNSLEKTLQSLSEIKFTPVGKVIFEEMHEFL